MRTFTLVVEPYGSEARQRAVSLAARGADLVLAGEMKSLLDVLASEIRVAYGVDVRVHRGDLAEPGGVEAALHWLDGARITVHRVQSMLHDEPDAARRTRLREALHALAGQLSARPLAQKLGGTLWRDGAPSQHPSAFPPASQPPPPRERTSTAPGHSDPE